MSAKNGRKTRHRHDAHDIELFFPFSFCCRNTMARRLAEPSGPSIHPFVILWISELRRVYVAPYGVA